MLVVCLTGTKASRFLFIHIFKTFWNLITSAFKIILLTIVYKLIGLYWFMFFGDIVLGTRTIFILLIILYSFPLTIQTIIGYLIPNQMLIFFGRKKLGNSPYLLLLTVPYLLMLPPPFSSGISSLSMHCVDP